ncbi:MAG TPA: cobyrinate a,c-diamide synthase [Candidatus Sulfotelmatobacter sp.]|nr:cobyrinate a,c-diamide synthase [Candidatus Sulfotelmatobacter sp.]
MTAPGLIVAAPATGSGKTSVTLGLLGALRRRGLRVAAAKVGPDYIDPGFHAAASGRDCLNLDPWAMRPAMLDALAATAGRDADLLLVEGVMGLFDGARDGSGSTADLAARCGWPVLLVVDARGQGGSVAAVVEGFRRFRREVGVVGVIGNRVGGAAHADLLRRALAPLDIAVLGLLPPCADIALPSRHLGLVPAAEQAGLAAHLDAAAAWVAAHLDLDRLVALARPARTPAAVAAPPSIPPLGQRIAVAADAAFAFAYPHLLQHWREAGASLLPFSPLADAAPDPTADAVYLPGGYPELHAGRLAGNAAFLAGLRGAAARGAAVYGECGGYMVLGEGLVDATGARHPMAGLLPVETSFAVRRLHLGYRAITLLGPAPIGAAGARFRGHEFHYASLLSEAAEMPLFGSRDALGTDLGTVGARRGSVFGSFLHLIDRE